MSQVSGKIWTYWRFHTWAGWKMACAHLGCYFERNKYCKTKTIAVESLWYPQSILFRGRQKIKMFTMGRYCWMFEYLRALFWHVKLHSFTSAAKFAFSLRPTAHALCRLRIGLASIWVINYKTSCSCHHFYDVFI